MYVSMIVHVQIRSFICPQTAAHFFGSVLAATRAPICTMGAATCCCAAKDEGVEVTAAAAYSVSADSVDERFLEATQKRYQISIQKTEQNDQLGMDVKHRLGRLVVLAIRRGGAVDRANVMAKQQGLPAMQVNDVIVEVNGATLDTGMVAACKSAMVLNVTFIRREHG